MAREVRQRERLNHRWLSCAAIGLAFLIGLQLGQAGIASCAEPVDFDTQVIPVLTRQGCNAGSCHGAAVGRGGFKLSLLGSNAAADHDAIVHHLEGRRVNLAEAGKSLLLRKASEQIGHEGGLALPDDSPAFELVRCWITEGAVRRDDRRLIEFNRDSRSRDARSGQVTRPRFK